MQYWNSNQANIRSCFSYHNWTSSRIKSIGNRKEFIIKNWWYYSLFGRNGEGSLIEVQNVLTRAESSPRNFPLCSKLKLNSVSKLSYIKNEAIIQCYRKSKQKRTAFQWITCEFWRNAWTQLSANSVPWLSQKYLDDDWGKNKGI